mmetsp:Transcript_123864/g.358232  ORF Transcript_123864/g.358232 Transcript_123864/m.358232 type:complete len:129 (+) Transcript_123864:481-867(+)
MATPRADATGVLHSTTRFGAASAMRSGTAGDRAGGRQMTAFEIDCGTGNAAQPPPTTRMCIVLEDRAGTGRGCTGVLLRSSLPVFALRHPPAGGLWQTMRTRPGAARAKVPRGECFGVGLACRDAGFP